MFLFQFVFTHHSANFSEDFANFFSRLC